jgi:enoyl-CoA hydratase
MEGFEHIHVSLAEGVATVLLRRPVLENDLNSQALREILGALGALDTDPSVRVLVFTGADDRASCAGSDRQETGNLDGEAIRKRSLLDFRCKTRIAHARTPTIAAIRGLAQGSGLELALACDVRFASNTSTFAFPEIGRGTAPGSAAIRYLPAIVGQGLAADLLLTGREIDAQEAWRIGLVNYVCEPEQLFDKVHAYARRIAGRNPLAVQGVKSALQQNPLLATGLESAYQSLLAYACRPSGQDREQVDPLVVGGEEP